MLTVNSPYFHVQAIRRMYRDQGIPTLAKPFMYVLPVNFPNAGVVTPGERGRGILQIDADSDFVWDRLRWYAQDVPFDPPDSVSINTEPSTYEISRYAFFEIQLRELDSSHRFQQPEFLESILAGGWIGIAAAGVQTDLNEGDINPVAGQDVGFAALENPFPEPIILKASRRFEITLRNRAAANSTESTHLFGLHGTKLFRYP
jgi:hypothetical protein